MEEYENARISKLRDYLFEIIDTLANNNEYQINADMLSNDVNNYSLNRIPVQPVLERWITGFTRYREVYAFRSRMSYSQDVINNLSNINFFENFEEIIKQKNKNGELPEIEGIESIECLNYGTLLQAGTNTAMFEIQVQIIYREEGDI